MSEDYVSYVTRLVEQREGAHTRYSLALMLRRRTAENGGDIGIDAALSIVNRAAKGAVIFRDLAGTHGMAYIRAF